MQQYGIIDRKSSVILYWVRATVATASGICLGQLGRDNVRFKRL